MAKEYIEREALLKWFEPYLGVGETWVEIHPVLDAVYALPAADVAPVVHGRWIYKNGRIVCDQCETVYAVCPNRDDAKELMNEMKGFEKFCFNCGAKMDGE